MNRISLDVNEITKDYRSGVSEKSLADRFGVSRQVIRLRLIQQKVPIRGRRDAELVKWSRMTPAQRTCQVAAAHQSWRGKTQAIAHRMKVAKGIERSLANTSHYEIDLGSHLSLLDANVMHQRAIGPYNADLSFDSVAVEVFAGGWHLYGRHRERLCRRTRYLLDSGWHVVFVTIEQRHVTFSPSVIARNLIAWNETVRADPSTPRQYRVIRGDGQWRLAGGLDSVDVTLVDAIRNGFRKSA